MSLSVVIPNYNGSALLRQYLPSALAAAEAAGADAVVLSDDCSSDDSVETAAAISRDIEIIRRDANGGFGEAVNTGASRVASTHMAVVMTDLEMEPDCLKQALAAAVQEDAFAVGFAMRAATDSGNESITALPFKRGLFHTEFPEASSPGSYRSEICEVAFALGGAMVVNKSRFDELGGFDPVYAPFFWEDVDLCWRAWRNGWRSVCCGSAIGWHRHPHKTVEQTASSSRVEQTVWRNRILFIRKNITGKRFLLEHRIWLAWMLAKRRISGSDLLRSAVWEAEERMHLLQPENRGAVRMSDAELIRRLARPCITRQKQEAGPEEQGLAARAV